MIVQTQLRDPIATVTDPDEALSTRLRDLALVEIDSLIAGLASVDAQTLIAAFADDVADALREAKTRIAALRQALAGPDPLNVVDLQSRQRASDAGQAGAERVRARLIGQAEAGRAMARLAELSSGLVSKLFEADRRRDGTDPNPDGALLSNLWSPYSHLAWVTRIPIWIGLKQVTAKLSVAS